MKSIVITGGTKGIGYGMAKSFLQVDCKVMISSRSQENVEHATAALAAHASPDRVAGFPCDVGEINQMEKLWAQTVDAFGKVDVWINNAGLGHLLLPPWEITPQQARQLIDANILGTVNGAQVAMRGMLNQGRGQIYNMLGFGANGQTRTGMSLYGTTKAAVAYFSRALAAEAEDTPVLVGTLQPGMVITDLITERYEDDPQAFARHKTMLNIVADTVDNVAPFLTKRILENRKNGVRISYISKPKFAWRFLTAPFNKRDLFTTE